MKWPFKKREFRLEDETEWLKGEIEVRDELIEQLNEDVLDLRMQIINLEAEKKRLIGAIKIEPPIKEGSNRKG